MPDTSPETPKPKKQPKTRDDIDRARIASKAAQASAFLGMNFEILNKQLEALGIPLEAEALADGTRRLVSTINGAEAFRLEPTTETLRDKGSIAVPGVHAYRAFAVEQQTIEASFETVINAHVPPGRQGYAARMMSQFGGLFFAAAWDLTQDEHAALGVRSMRRGSLRLRKKTGAAIGRAYDVSPEAGAAMRHAVGEYPCTTAAFTEDELVETVQEGASILDRMKEHGGTSDLRHLAQPAINLITKRSMSIASAAIAAARSAASLPRNSQQKFWLQACLYVGAVDEPAPGFHEWFFRVTSTEDMRFIPYHVLNSLSAWATATQGRREGWRTALTFKGALVRADAWLEGQDRQARANAKGGKGPSGNALPLVLPDRVVGEDVYLVQIKSSADMHAAGIALHVCLAGLCGFYTKRAETRSAAYLGLHAVDRGKQGEAITLHPGKLLAVAEIKLDPNGTPDGIGEFSAHSNAAPSKKLRSALTTYLSEIK